jgi:hypothetical protein
MYDVTSRIDERMRRCMPASAAMIAGCEKQIDATVHEQTVEMSCMKVG